MSHSCGSLTPNPKFTYITLGDIRGTEVQIVLNCQEIAQHSFNNNYTFFFFFCFPKSSLHAEGFGGSAGRTSSLTHTGTQFSTKDRDNDRCTCKCAQLASGGMQPPRTYATHLPCPSQSVSPYNLVKHFYPPPCKCPEVHFIFPLRQYKVTADLQLYIWVLHFMSTNSINSDFFLELSDTFPAGWWFEACGPSNLNGIYYPASSSVVRYNGIKWYYWKGPNLMATMTTMMVRPTHF